MPAQAIDHRHVEIAVQFGIRRVVTIGAFHIHHIAVEARAKTMVELHLPFFAYAGEIEVYEVDHYTVHHLQWRFGIAFMHHALSEGCLFADPVPQAPKHNMQESMRIVTRQRGPRSHLIIKVVSKIPIHRQSRLRSLRRRMYAPAGH